MFDLFERAIALDASDRVAFVEEVAAGDAEKRAELIRLVEAHERLGSFLEKPGETGSHDGEPDGLGDFDDAGVRGRSIGKYKLLEKIGEGGFSVVYLAEQLSPVRRQVAVKVLKIGVDSKAAVARLEAERQALAMMEHPNIAKVFDGGVTDGLRPYIVMELVRGMPINEYCDSHRITVEERLQVFCDVARAVEHAHVKGIIHRDIKPSNVLVSRSGDRAVPKVIDFGIAKAMHRPLTDRTLFTGFHQVIGTPAYMSPEQAEAGSVPADTRSDIYSLGVLLYEILVGTTPIDSETLRSAAIGQLSKLIKENHAPLPSDRLRETADADRIAAERLSDPERLAGALKGDLDWIVLRCLEKDMGRRYQTVGGLIDDIDRYRRDEPIEARPPSMLYKLRKFVKRHRIPVVTAAVLALLALSALVGASGGLMWALSERSIAQRALEESQRSKRESDALNGLLREAFATPSPRSLGRTATALDVLDNASQILLSGAVGAPNDKPSLLISLAETMLDVGEHDRAVELLRRAQLLSLERRIDGRRQYAHATTLLSLTLLESGRADEALREISSVSGVDDETSVVVTDRDPELALLQSDVWLGLGRPERAIALLDRIDASWSMSYRDLLGLAIRRANAAMLRGRYSEAIRMVRDARARSGEELDDADPAVIRAERVLAAAFLDAGSLGEAIRTLRDLHDVAATRFGPGHVRTLEIADDLMRAALHSGEIEGSTESTRGAAVSLDSFAIEQGRIARESLREGHPLRERILAAGGRLLRAAGRPEEAERLMLGRADPGGLAGGAPRSFEELYFEGRELLNVGRFDDAIGALERARVASVGTPDSSVRLIDLRVRLIDAYASRGDLDGAVEVLEELLARSRPETEFALGRVIEAVHTVVISAAGDPRFEPRADRALDLLLERADAIFVATEWDTGRRELTEVFAEVAARRGREFGERLLVERRRVFLSNLREPTTIERRELRAIETYEMVAVPTSGRPAGGMRFDGLASYVLVPGFHFVGGEPFTIEAIATPEAISQRYTCIFGSNESSGLALGITSEWSDGPRYEFSWWGGREDERTDDLGYIRVLDDRAARTNAAVHLVGVWDGDSISMYRDGMLVSRLEDVDALASVSALATTVGAGPSWRIGMHHFFRGKIEGVRIRSGVHPPVPDAIGRLDPTPDDLVLLDFKENTGSVVPDRSGNGYHGFVFGGEWIEPELR